MQKQWTVQLLPIHPGSNGNFLMLKKVVFFAYCLKKTYCFSTGTLLRWFGLSVDTIFGGLISFQGSLKDKPCLHRSCSMCRFQVLTVTSVTEEQMLTCSRQFRSVQIHAAIIILMKWSPVDLFIYLFYFTEYAACRRASICSYFTPVPFWSTITREQCLWSQQSK